MNFGDTGHLFSYNLVLIATDKAAVEFVSEGSMGSAKISLKPTEVVDADEETTGNV